jgi:hypothetical protein
MKYIYIYYSIIEYIYFIYYYYIIVLLLYYIYYYFIYILFYIYIILLLYYFIYIILLCHYLATAIIILTFKIEILLPRPSGDASYEGPHLCIVPHQKALIMNWETHLFKVNLA